MLERRDCTSGDLLNIAAEKIRIKLEGISAYRNAEKIGLYYPIGSEIPTLGIIRWILGSGKQVCLPRILGKDLEFHEIHDMSDLEMGSFDIMEPKERCPIVNPLDVVLVPSVCMSPNGARIGYGRGFYDRFLGKNKTVTISLILEKQIVRNIPQSEYDQRIDWIVTEDKIYAISHSR